MYLIVLKITPLVLFSSLLPLICTPCPRSCHDPAHDEQDQGSCDAEHDHRGVIDGDGLLSSQHCHHRPQDHSGCKEHKDYNDGRVGTNAVARLMGRATIANIVAEMKYKVFLT